MVSIIIPFNNGNKYLKKCLQSLCGLNYNDFEVILVDDYSGDNSEEIAKNYSNKLNIKYYYVAKETIGVGNARNLGIQKASEKYIMFVDVDDTIEANLLKDFQQYIEKDIDIIKYKMKIIEDGKEVLTRGAIFDVTDGQDGFNRLYFNDKFLDSPCLYLIKKDLFERTKLRFEKNVYHEDFGLIPQLIVNAKSIVSTEYYGYNYFQSSDSIMRNNDYSKEIKKVNDKFTHYNNLIKNLSMYELTNQTKENLLSFYTNSIIMSLKNLKHKDRRFFEKKIKQEKLLSNIHVKNLKQMIKKILLRTNMEMYFVWQK